MGPVMDHYRCYHITKTQGGEGIYAVEFSPSKTAMPQTSSKDLTSIAALEMSNTSHNPAPAAPFSHIGTTQLQALRQLPDIFMAALTPMAPQHSPPTSQASSQFRNIIPPSHVPMLGFPCPETPSPAPTYLATPRQSPRLARYPYPRVSPSQTPSPSVVPRVNPRHVASPRVDPTIPQHSVTSLIPHPAAPNSPYVPQGMAGENIFDTFEEEHMETPSLPRCSTGARAQQHSANIVQHHAPCVFHPITFTNNQGCHISPQRAINQIPMANAVIIQDTGTSLEYRQLIHDEATFPIWNKEAENEFGRISQGVGGRIEGSNTIFFIPRQTIPKGKVVTHGRFVVDTRPKKSEVHHIHLTVGGNLIQHQGDVSTR
jgi:hypothetical protein